MLRCSHLRPRNLTLSQQTPERQRLITLMQQICFGAIYDLRIRWGEPVWDPPPRVVRRKKFGGINQPRAQAGQTDFVLKREVVELLNEFDNLRNGVLPVIQIAHGLPIVYEFEDAIRV
jgi:hypothetical protein